MPNRSTRTHVYFLQTARARRAGQAVPRSLLGAQGSQLLELAEDGWPVLPGFIISADVCAYAARHGLVFAGSA